MLDLDASTPPPARMRRQAAGAAGAVEWEAGADGAAGDADGDGEPDAAAADADADGATGTAER